MRRLIVAVVLAAATALAVAGSATAGNQVVPIKASLAGHIVPTAPLADCGLPNLVVATGEMSHLGNFEADIHVGHCAMAGPTEMVITGTAEIVAANGDELDIPAWAFKIDVVSGAFTFTQNDILGGTGRFEHASGSLTGSGTFDLNPLSPTYGTGAWTVAGTIINVGSTK